MALLSLSSCAHITIPETVKNAEWCHPFKNQVGQDIGASCDYFLTSKPELLNADQWAKKQSDWMASGGVTEVTTSKTMIDLKVFVEDTCSQIQCDEKTKNAIIASLDKVSSLGKKEEGIQ